MSSASNKVNATLPLYSLPKSKEKIGKLIERKEGIGGGGRITTALTKSIAYERNPSLFDEKEIEERDREVMESLRQEDRRLCIDRKNKPVFLTPTQTRIVYALSYGLSQIMETDQDVKEKIEAIRTKKKRVGQISKVVNITELAKFIFGSARKRIKEQIIEELYTLSHIRQVQIFGTGEDKVRITAPLINLGIVVEDLSPEKRNNLDLMEVTFGLGFFYDLDKRYSYLTPQLFEVWRKNGRATQLYSVLLSSLLAVYWTYKTKAELAEKRIRKESKETPLSPDELSSKIKEARVEAMSYELNVTTIKKRVTTDYESDKTYRRKFWKDLDNAVEGFKEANLIERVEIKKGVKGQDKIIFIFSETYNAYEIPTSGYLLDSPS